MSKKILKGAWCIFLVLPMAMGLWDVKQMNQNIEIFSKISIFIVFQNLLVICAVIIAVFALTKVAPFLEWSWFSLFTQKNHETGEEKPHEGTNIHLIPASVKYFGLVFLVIFAANLPEYARMEEVMFREGTISWEHGLLMSLLFGMVHCIVGVPLAAGLAISIVGIWLTHQYFAGGIELSTIHHTAYNLILVSALFIGSLLAHIADLLPKQEKTT
jgi:hypothetical protein